MRACFVFLLCLAFLPVRAQDPSPDAFRSPEGLYYSCPVFAPWAWNDGGYSGDGRTVQGNSNCYAYACNQRGPFLGGFGMAPGTTSGEPVRNPAQASVQEVRSKAIADGLLAWPVNGSYPVFLAVAPGVEYHWYRMDANGQWSHKRGASPATNLDASGRFIFDPAFADRRYGAVDYSLSGGYLWVPPYFHF